MKKEKATKGAAKLADLVHEIVIVGSDFLSIEPDDLDINQARSETRRLQRTISCLIAIDICTREKAEQAYEIAGWK